MLVRAVVVAMLLFSVISSPDSRAQSTVTKADVSRARSEIELLKQNIQIKEAELRLMEQQLARQSTVSPTKTTSKPVTSANAAQAKPVSQPVPAPLTPESTPAPKRANVDPKPYEASVVQRIAMFRTDGSAKWLVLDEERVVFWVLDDEAYLVNLAVTCSGLLDAKSLKLENFSSKVRAGHDGVLFDDQRCQIQSIQKLGGRALPKPPRN